ncbi:oligopeptide ABC transporter permease [Caldinitratiruptor microaerophilus]|uniref:Peptide ABC transporter permease n=1 Tax=Caldinitratiruptor microaerophilus TaxID=671077 RepID=A0AA35CM25_9FIRM|nr:oligopeptide ABC transporter permease [Caldinitratiruptor microaerophilus]BDG61830.1 peptide ABC transporter permease [Caldinitratiruptor microaerophilus]
MSTPVAGLPHPDGAFGLPAGAWRRFARNPLAVAGAAVLLIFIVLALVAPYISPHDPAAVDLLNVNAPPSRAHPLGTDPIGRDILSRLLYGARISLLVGFTVAAGAVTVGSLVGAVAGYFGGWADTVLMRLVDVMLSYPSLFLNILVLVLFGGDFKYLVLILILNSWMGVARLVRASFLQLREMPYVEAARAIGVPTWRIMLRHLLPGASAPIIVYGTLMVGTAILVESALSFLGLGVQPPQTSWGQMLFKAQEYMLTNPWLAVYPGLCIFLTVLAVNFVGDGIRDALDPRQPARIPRRRMALWRARLSR